MISIGKERYVDLTRSTRLPFLAKTGENLEFAMHTFVGSGFDRGHLVASANHTELLLQNSETFLLSNMSPQHEDLNRRKWVDLEKAIRKLNKNKKYSKPMF